MSARRVATITLVVVLGALLLSGAAKDRTLKSPTLKAVAGKDAFVKSAGLRWYNDGPGSGGWIPDGEFHPADPRYILLGSDTSGPWISADLGATYVSTLDGLKGNDLGKASYVGGIVGVNAPWYDGWYIATQAGIYRSDSRKATTWTRETTPALGYIYLNANFYDQTEAIAFDDIAWDGDDLLVAGAGWGAWGRENSANNWSHYPVSAKAGTVLMPADDSRHSLWRKIHGDAFGEKWRPWPGLGNKGNARSVAIRVAGIDTMVAVVTKDGLWAHSIEAPWTNFATEYGWTCNGLTGTWSGFGGGSSSDYTMWQCAITERGILYATMTHTKSPHTGQPTSGVYAIDIHDPADGWYFIGGSAAIWPDGLSIHQASEGDDCTASVGSGCVWPWLAVNSGPTSDIVTIGDQRTTRGVLRTTVTNYGAENQIWQPIAYALYSTPSYITHNYEFGWQDAAFGACEFVSTLASNPNYIIADLAQVQISTNGGSSWKNEYSTSSSYATTHGQSQLCPNDAVQLDDHRIVTSAWDASIFVSDTSDMGNWIISTPTTISVSDTTAAADETWARQAWDLATYDNFQRTGRQALLALFADDSRAHAGKVMAWWDTDGDGDREWTSPSSVWPGAACTRPISMAVMPDGAILCGYIRYTTYNGSTVSDRGVLRLTWSGSAWVSSRWVGGTLPATAQPVKFCVAGTQVFAACEQASGVTGGVYYRNYDGTNDWATGFTSPGDVRSICANPAGTTVYAGSAGWRSGWGTVRRCTNPSGAPATWTDLANSGGVNTFGFVKYTNHPATDYWDSYATDFAFGSYQTWVKDLRVDPNNPTDLYACLGPTDGYVNMRTPSGVWKYNGSTWSKVDIDLPSDGLSAAAVRFIGYPNRAMLGHDCTDWDVARLDGGKLSTYNRIRPAGTAPTITGFNIDTWVDSGGVWALGVSGTSSAAGDVALQWRRSTDATWQTSTATGLPAAWSTTITTSYASATPCTVLVQARPKVGSGDAQLIGEWYLDTQAIAPPAPATACLAGLTVSSEMRWDALCGTYAAVDVTYSAAPLAGGYLAVQKSYDGGFSWETAYQVGGTERAQIGSAEAHIYVQSEGVKCSNTVNASVKLRYNVYSVATGGSPLYGSWCGPQTTITFR